MARENESESLLLVGRIFRAHGVHGEVKVVPETDSPERFEDLPAVFTGRTAGTAERRKIESVRLQPSKGGAVVVLKMEGVDSRDDADALRRMLVFADIDELPALEEDEYFIHDLIGLDVLLEDGAHVGVVENVLELPAQDVLVVSREGRPDAMVPVVEEFVVDIDVEKARIVIRPIEGLLEE